MNSLLTFFTGLWAYERRISQPDITVYGVASFEDIDAHSKAFHEEGAYHLNGTQYSCFQKQTWIWSEQKLTLLKHDGNILHVFDLEPADLPLQLQHTHSCGADTYTSSFDVLSHSQWRTTYHVSGPRKNYTSVTVFSRQDP